MLQAAIFSTGFIEVVYDLQEIGNNDQITSVILSWEPDTTGGDVTLRNVAVTMCAYPYV